MKKIISLVFVLWFLPFISSAAFIFTKDLSLGMTDPDVIELQKVLNSDPATVVAQTGPGSTGNETSYFGELTKSAVIKFQNKYYITPPYGYVGPKTREKLNTLTGNVSTVTPGNEIVLLTANGVVGQTVVYRGTNVDIKWYAANVSKCYIGFVDIGLSGTTTIKNIQLSTDYIIKCDSPTRKGIVGKVSIIVNQNPPPFFTPVSTTTISIGTTTWPYAYNSTTTWPYGTASTSLYVSPFTLDPYSTTTATSTDPYTYLFDNNAGLWSMASTSPFATSTYAIGPATSTEDLATTTPTDDADDIIWAQVISDPIGCGSPAKNLGYVLDVYEGKNKGFRKLYVWTYGESLVIDNTVGGMAIGAALNQNGTEEDKDTEDNSLTAPYVLPDRYKIFYGVVDGERECLGLGGDEYPYISKAYLTSDESKIDDIDGTGVNDSF